MGSDYFVRVRRTGTTLRTETSGDAIFLVPLAIWSFAFNFTPRFSGRYGSDLLTSPTPMYIRGIGVTCALAP